MEIGELRFPPGRLERRSSWADKPVCPRQTLKLALKNSCPAGLLAGGADSPSQKKHLKPWRLEVLVRKATRFVRPLSADLLVPAGFGPNRQLFFFSILLVEAMRNRPDRD